MKTSPAIANTSVTTARLTAPLVNQDDFLRLLVLPELKRMAAVSLSVVFNPDGDTQLALHVKLQHGRFEVMAVLERGNSTAVSAGWSRLQNRLAKHGIRLAPLVSSDDHAAWCAEGSFSGTGRTSGKLQLDDLPAPVIPKPPTRSSSALRVLATADVTDDLN